MAKYNYYAVKIGRNNGIYRTWDECSKQVNGHHGALYRGFMTLSEAEAYLNDANSNGEIDEVDSVIDTNTQIRTQIEKLSEDEAIAFIDGSCNANEEKSAFGAIIFSGNDRKEVLYKAFSPPIVGRNFLSLRNVSAELEGAKEVINWTIQYNKAKITIYYDYAGIEKWATGEWKAKTVIAQDYSRFIHEKTSNLEICFVKIESHTGIEFNEEADRLARNALLAKGYKTYDDGSVYFVGYNSDDWSAIVDYINDENNELLHDTIPAINVQTSSIGNREKIKLVQGKNTVVINCYQQSKSYVQGKQTVLFQKLIATAIGFMSDNQTVVETLNSYHALTLSIEDVENQFEQLLPHYRMETEKQYANLLSAVYNTMLTGYMPDYTCLVTPIFRTYEYYLHRILGDTMGLATEKENGTNNFSYFLRNNIGKYECNSPKTALLTLQQQDYLNDLYTKYNSVRHPYSHWSAEDVETAVIPDIQTARQLLLEGIEIIDRYYTVF